MAHMVRLGWHVSMSCMTNVQMENVPHQQLIIELYEEKIEIKRKVDKSGERNSNIPML